MDDQLFHPIIPEGMHLVKPHDNPNVVLGSLFDEGNLCTGRLVGSLRMLETKTTIAPHTRHWLWAFLSAAATVGTAVYLARNEKVREVWDRTVGRWWNHTVVPPQIR